MRLSQSHQEKVEDMHQFHAVFYELKHELSGRSVIKSFMLVTTLMIIVLGSTTELFFKGYTETSQSVFTFAIALFWVGIFNSITVICRIRPRIKSQVVQGLSIGYYIMANAAFQLIQCLFQAAIVTFLFGAASHFKIIEGCPSDGVVTKFFIELFLFAFLVIFSADTLGLAISSICRNEVSAMTTMPFVLIAEMVLSNALFKLPEIGDFSLGWLSIAMISRWGVELLGTICHVTSYPMLIPDMLPDKWPELLYSFDKVYFLKCIAWLLLISIVNILASVVLLRHIKKENLL